MAGGWHRARRLLGTTTAVALVCGFLTSRAMAQSNSGKVSVSTGTDFSHAYFFRGIVQERSGIVAQPYMDMTFSLFEGTEGLNSVTFTIGQWNSLHTGPTGNAWPATNVGAWYESDFYTGFAFGIDNWDVGLTYTAYLSPNDTFGTVKEVALSLAVDDSMLLGRFTLSPYVRMAIELGGQADGGAGEGVYFELGVEPGLSLEGTPVSLSFPVTPRPEPVRLLRGDTRERRRVRLCRPRPRGERAAPRARVLWRLGGQWGHPPAVARRHVDVVQRR